ncbi:MAG: tetratricopeptide repeat protein [Tannerellaceae bacterium]|jgi:tetratricopeptide (TPR) repeat protein|nr:tetratricopeptide repeat protein [Tannerellaceae bacterium]
MKFLAKWVIVCLLATGYANGQTYEELIGQSYDHLDKGDLPAAEESLKAAMRLEPANPYNYALLTNLGTIQRRQGKTEEAILSYTTALSRQPDNELILENRASLYAETGEHEKALADYTSLLLLNPDNQDALYNRGLIHVRKKDFLSAEIDFDKILEVNEKSVHGRLGHAILEKMRGNYDESERIYNYLIGELPREWPLYESRADLYFLMGKNGRAMADINKLFVETPPNAALYILRGKVKLAQYERESAVKDFLTAKEMGYDPAIADELIRMAK